MENKKCIFFITSYKDEMLNDYQILINNKNQEQYFLIKIIKKGISYSIFINEIEAIPYKTGKIIIPIVIKKRKKQKNYYNNYESNNYNIEIDINEKSYLFLFDYSLIIIKENLSFIKFLFPFQNRQKLINEYFSIFEKFVFFIILLNSKTKNSLFYEYYFELSKTLIEHIKKYKEKESINIELLIYILIFSLYKENFFPFTSLIELNINIDYSNENFNLIFSNRDKYLPQVMNLLDILKKINTPNKNNILEIIIIYFIKYNYYNINYLFDDKEIKDMIIQIFKLEKTLFLSEEMLDEKITEIFFNHCPNIEYVLGLLKQNDNYISYLQKINNNSKKIFREVKSLKSLKGLFNINFKVSQQDDSFKLVELHHSILEKEKKENKYFINFTPIIEKYKDLYIKYKNLDGLCSLEIIT